MGEGKGALASCWNPAQHRVISAGATQALPGFPWALRHRGRPRPPSCSQKGLPTECESLKEPPALKASAGTKEGEAKQRPLR